MRTGTVPGSPISTPPGMKKNYFEILNLSVDPLELSVDVALSRLKQCTNEWKSAPQDDVLKKTWLEAAPVIEKTLSNPSILSSLAKDALIKEKKRVLHFLKAAAIGNEIPQAIFRNICNNVELKADTIAELAAEEGLVISKRSTDLPSREMQVPEKPDANHPVHLVASRDIQKLQLCLEAAGKKSIYEYLNSDSRLSSEQLLKCNTEKRNEPNKGGSANNPVNTIKIEITGIGAKYFKNEDSKKRYDYAWRTKEIADRALSAFPNYVEGSPGSITPFYYRKLYEALLAEGLDRTDSQWLVYRRCCQGKDKVSFPWEEKFEECPKCKHRNENGSARCSKCGELLRVNCPRCGKAITPTAGKCHCGVKFDAARKIYETLENASKATKGNSGELEKALGDIQGIIRTYPDYVPAKALLGELQKAKVALLLDTLEAPAIRMVQAVGDDLQIVWSKAKQKGQELERLPDAQGTPISYMLRRKIGGIPRNAEDGEALPTCSQSPCVDKQARPGVEYGYAVFATVGKRILGGGSGGSGIVLPPAELAMAVGDGKIELSWCSLPSGWRVTLIRKEGSEPSSPSDGSVLPVSSGNTYTDSGLTNGSLYGYMLVLSNGKYSVTARSTGTPQKPPPALTPEQWSYERRGADLHITWELPTGADEVRWLVTDKMPAAPRSVVPAARYEGTGETDKELGTTILRGVNPCGKYIVPLVIKGESALVCEGVHGGLQKLRLRRNIEQVVLEWEWPDDCTEVQVVYSDKAFADTPDDAGSAEPRSCIRQGSEKMHQLKLARMKPDSDFYFSVFMRTGANSWSAPRQIYSPGTKSRKVISCRVVRKGNDWVFEARSRHGGIPALEVRCARNVLPLSRQDGKLALKVEASAQPVVSTPIPNALATPGTCFMPFIAGLATHTLQLNRKSLTIA